LAWVTSLFSAGPLAPGVSGLLGMVSSPMGVTAEAVAANNGG